MTTMNNLLQKEKTVLAHTMLQQLQNLASDDTIHGYQTCPLVESFLPNSYKIAESQIEDCLELNFWYVDYQPLAVLPILYSSYV